MIPVWRLTRNRYARRLYDYLAAVDVTATRMIEFEAELDDHAPVADGSVDIDPLPGVSIAAGPAGDELKSGVDLDFSIPVSYLDEEWAVVATADDEAVGRALVSAGQRPYVEPLRTRMSFDGAYVRRVYVARHWRGNGIAKRLVGEALRIARRDLDADAAYALVAADNRPSQRVFEATGFARVRRHDYVRLRRWEHRLTAELADRADA